MNKNQYSVLSALGMNNMQMGQMLMYWLQFFKGVVSIPSLFLEIFIRPRFGTRYFFIVTPILTWILLQVWLLGTMVLGMLPFAPQRVGVFNIGSLLVLFDITCIVHGIRVWWLMTHMNAESDSEYEGPRLPIYNMLPNHDSWAWVRVVYEPATCLFSTILAFRLHIIGISAFVFLLVATFCLFFKTIILWYEGWQYIRILRDNQSRSEILRDLAAGRPAPQTIGGVVLAGIPSDIMPETRNAIAHSMVGLTPELDALVTPVEVSQ